MDFSPHVFHCYSFKASGMRISDCDVTGWLVLLKALIKCQYKNEPGLKEHFPNFFKTIQ